MAYTDTPIDEPTDGSTDNPTDGSIELRRGPLDVAVSARCGGSILRFARHRGDGTRIDLMRPTPADALERATAVDTACFPLVPYSNRIAWGRFTFDERAICLPPQADDPHAIHGHGWRTPWRVESRSPDRLRLSYRQGANGQGANGLGANGWPFAYQAFQSFELMDDRLRVTLDLENQGPEPMPAGLGLHPYFPKPPGTVLTARVGSVWLVDEAILPVRRAAVPDAWAFTHGRTLDDAVLDNGFAGWDGQARITWPGLDTTLTIAATMDAPAVGGTTPFRHLVVYAPRGDNFFCVEPVSHMTDAVNRGAESDNGMVVLGPQQRLTARIEFIVAAG